MLRKSLLGLALVPMLSGCVAALLPVAAAGFIGKGEIDRVAARREIREAGAFDAIERPGDPAPQDLAQYTGQGGALELDEEDTQYLSKFFKPLGEDEASPYAAFASFALDAAARREAGENVGSAVLIPRVRLEKPETMACAGKPLAVMIDLDDKAGENWLLAGTLYRDNDLGAALAQLRAAQISVIWLSDSPAGAAKRVSAILADAGLSQPEADDFLFLDRGTEDRKQQRRWDAARSYCIVAIAGDDKADFDELFDYLRDPEFAVSLNHKFDHGWFLTPPPLSVASGEEEPVEAEVSAK